MLFKHYVLIGAPSLVLLTLTIFLLSKIWLLSRIRAKCTRCELIKLHHGGRGTKRRDKGCQTRGAPEECVVRFI